MTFRNFKKSSERVSTALDILFHNNLIPVQMEWKLFNFQGIPPFNPFSWITFFPLFFRTIFTDFYFFELPKDLDEKKNVKIDQMCRSND